MTLLKACGRCGGDVVVRQAAYTIATCLQCGYERVAKPKRIVRRPCEVAVQLRLEGVA